MGAGRPDPLRAPPLQLGKEFESFLLTRALKWFKVLKIYGPEKGSVVKAIPWVICVVFILAGLIGTYLFYSEQIQNSTKLALARTDLEKTTAALAGVQADLDSWQKTGGAPKSFLADVIKEAKLEGQDATMKALIPLRTGQKDKSDADLAALLKSRDEAIAAAKEAYQTLQSTETSVNGQIGEALNQSLEISRRIDTDAKRLAGEVFSETEKAKQLNQTVAKERAGWKSQTATLKSDTEFMKSQLARLQEESNPKIDLLSEPDATVSLADYGRRFVVLDIGRKQGVKKGMVFTVYRKTAEGQLLVKGRVIANQIYDDYCEAGIGENKKQDVPIISGDLAQSPEFPQRLRYYFFGDFAGAETLGYSASDLTELVKQSGGLALNKLDITTDVVLLGDISRLRNTEEFSSMLKTAREFHTKLMRVPQFLQELRK